MSRQSNNAIIYRKLQPYGPIEDGTLVFEKRPYDLPEPRDGDVIIQTMYCALDIFLRFRIRDPAPTSFIPAFEIGKPIDGFIIGRVIDSKNPSYQEGQFVWGIFPFAEYTYIPVNQIPPLYRPIVLQNRLNLPWTVYLGVLGLGGSTAYIGVNEIAKFNPGETVVVSSAFGPVGQVVCQMAKLAGCHVVGIAGSDEKIKYLLDQKYCDSAFNYKKERAVDTLPKLCSDGIDVYWDNTGGEILDAVYLSANDFARIVACGFASNYGNPKPYGLVNYGLIAHKRLLVQGFIQTDLIQKYYMDFMRDMENWVASGQIKYNEQIVEGLENCVAGLKDVFEGRSFGKSVLKVSD